MVDGVGLAVVAGQDRDVSIGRLPAHRSDDGGELRPAHGLTGVVVDRRDRGGGQRGGDTTGGAGVGSLPHPPQCTCISTPALRSRGGHDNRSRPLDRQPSPATRLYADYLHEEVGALDSDYVFVNLWGQPHGQPVTYATVYDLVKRLRRRTGVDFDPHWWRHSYATRLLRAGIPVEVVSKLLGHVCITTTIDTYGHLTAEDARQALQAAGFLTGREVVL